MKINSKRNKKVNVPTAQETLVATTPNALQYALSKINEAMEKGHTRCYVAEIHGRPVMAVIEELLKKGYDIRYHQFDRDDHWFVEADWSDRANGNIFHGDTFEKTRKVTLEEMFEIEQEFMMVPPPEEEAVWYIIEGLTLRERNILAENNITYRTTETMNEAAFDTMEAYYNAMVLIGREEA